MVDKQKRSLVIINDHQLLSDLFGEVLKKHGFDLVKSFTDVNIGLSYTLLNPPNLVMIEMMLPIMRTRDNEKADNYHPYILMDSQTSFRTVKQIRTNCINTKILLVTGERHPHTFHLGFEFGAHGIASKLDDLTSFIDILQQIISGEERVATDRMQLLLYDYKQTPMPILSPLEVQILELVQEGMESPEIGHKLGYATKTIRNEISKINEKLGSDNRYEALQVAIDMGLVGWRSSG